jgi:hypothetical protein
MAAQARALQCANDDEAPPSRGCYVPPAPTMGPIDRQFLQQFWGARYPVLVAPPAPETDW